MNTLAGLLAEPSAVVEGPLRVGAHAHPSIVRLPDGIRREQIQALIHQLFLCSDRRIRNVGFAAVEASTDTAQLCLDVATVLAGIGSHDVGLIDGRLQSSALHTELGIEGVRGNTTQGIAERLWLAPRSMWLENIPEQSIWDPSLSRLRAATMDFDYSVVSFDPLSWLTIRISQVCDGLVLVLTANRTRRLVAAQVQEQLRRARVPVLGVVLADRQFPVPEALYRSL